MRTAARRRLRLYRQFVLCVEGGKGEPQAQQCDTDSEAAMLAMVGYWPEARRSLELPCLAKPCNTAPTAAMGFEQRGLQQHGFVLVLPVSCYCWRHVAEFAGQRQVCYTGDWHPLLSQALLESIRCSGEGHELEGHWRESLSIKRFGATPSAR
jgi:hypothetical protein